MYAICHLGPARSTLNSSLLSEYGTFCTKVGKAYRYPIPVADETLALDAVEFPSPGEAVIDDDNDDGDVPLFSGHHGEAEEEGMAGCEEATTTVTQDSILPLPPTAIESSTCNTLDTYPASLPSLPTFPSFNTVCGGAFVALPDTVDIDDIVDGKYHPWYAPGVPIICQALVNTKQIISSRFSELDSSYNSLCLLASATRPSKPRSPITGRPTTRRPMVSRWAIRTLVIRKPKPSVTWIPTGTLQEALPPNLTSETSISTRNLANQRREIHGPAGIAVLIAES